MAKDVTLHLSKLPMDVYSSCNQFTNFDRGILNMGSDIVPGAVFPDYELSDHRGKRRKLSELQQQDPMVVVLSRGAYCPKDRFSARPVLLFHVIS